MKHKPQFLLPTLCVLAMACSKTGNNPGIQPLSTLQSGSNSQSLIATGTTTTLSADGPGNTYELINSKLGGTAVETPDCSHPSFGRHISEVFDNDLNKNVFVFTLHVTPDNDNCTNTDRQRVEIKTYGPSPDNLKAFNGDAVSYTWKFKLPAGFQPSPSFTHIHQIKAGDGDDGSPIITLTPRYNSAGNKLELIHINSSGTTTKVKTVDLSGFIDTWVTVTEQITFGSNGSYAVTIKKISDNSTLLSYSNSNIDLWRSGTTFCRPKWGFYRSLANTSYLRDESIRFADFTLTKF